MQTKAYSISQLETYTTCPFKYFLERVLKVEITEEPDEEIEAVEIGSLLHAILFEFYVKIREKNIILKNCSDKVFKIAENLIFEIAEKHVSETTKDSPFAFFEEPLNGSGSVLVYRPGQTSLSGGLDSLVCFSLCGFFLFRQFKIFGQRRLSQFFISCHLSRSKVGGRGNGRAW